MSVKFGGRFKNFRKGRTFLTLMILVALMITFSV